MNVARRASPYKLIAPVVPELDLQVAVAQALNVLLLPPAAWTAFPAGHIKLAPAQAARLLRIGMASGWPDLLVVCDRIYGIELKRQGGLLSRTRVVRTRTGAVRQVDGQVDTFDRLGRAGMKIAVCHSVDEVLAALAGWHVPFRRVAT